MPIKVRKIDRGVECEQSNHHPPDLAINEITAKNVVDKSHFFQANSEV